MAFNAARVRSAENSRGGVKIGERKGLATKFNARSIRGPSPPASEAKPNPLVSASLHRTQFVIRSTYDDGPIPLLIQSAIRTNRKCGGIADVVRWWRGRWNARRYRDYER